MQSFKYFLPVLFVAAFSFDASADEEDKWYAEAHVGSISPDFGEDGVDDFTLVGARFGYNFTSALSIEGDVSTGTNTQSRSFGYLIPTSSGDQVLVTQTTDNKLNWVVGVFGKGTFPVTERFSAHARLGLAAIETNTVRAAESISPSNNFEFDTNYSDAVAALGIGGTFDVTNSTYVRADITRYGLKTGNFEPELDSVTIGAGIRF